jgi:hypothetical protein
VTIEGDVEAAKTMDLDMPELDDDTDSDQDAEEQEKRTSVRNLMTNK